MAQFTPQKYNFDFHSTPPFISFGGNKFLVASVFFISFGGNMFFWLPEYFSYHLGEICFLVARVFFILFGGNMFLLRNFYEALLAAEPE